MVVQQRPLPTGVVTDAVFVGLEHAQECGDEVSRRQVVQEQLVDVDEGRREVGLEHRRDA